ncbi:hypothetical protein [Nitrosospira briensis]|uniref:hypothetical protein n=1 Tax=Nitrosospira briensis TaxID=35799 RepID=UPI0008E2FB78|nr:hypothetical protein [Nitrosospira briensis]SFO11559.1 hypothetical protein SAMN05216332_105119 [Nitrosospira briensis]
MKHETSTFLSGCAPFYDFFFFAKELDELTEKGTPNSSFFCFDEEDTDAQFRKYDESVNWPAIAMAAVKPEGSSGSIVAIGPNGDYWEVEPSSAQESVGKIAHFHGNLRALSVIEETIFASGMDRAVLEREEKGKWRSIGPSPTKDDADIIGFEDMDGYSKAEMYAVGWGGEIWWFDHGTWRQVDSPTSANLTALCCAADGLVYIVGDNGTMLRGRRDTWSVIDTDRMENLMDVAFFNGTIYVTTDFRVLKLADEKLVNDTDFADSNDLPATCLHLLTVANGLISLGTKDVFRRNQEPWKRLV